jgi:nucleoside 2-deoxyribosyltransferase
MTIYVAHSSSFDFKNELYIPLRQSNILKKHDVILPHEHSSQLYNSKEKLKECDLMLAEVSFPSTGLGIELGWANLYGVPIVCVYKKGNKPSSSLTAVTNAFFEYEDAQDMVLRVEKYIEAVE